MRKLLWHSNAPWAPTGYGTQTGLFGPRIREHYDIAVSAFYGLEGAPIRWDGVPVFPGIAADFGNSYILDHASKFFDGDLRGGAVVTLMDVWVLERSIFEQLDLMCWCPIDHEPAPPAVVEFLSETAAVPIAMSRFGQDMLRLLDPLYVPHAVDTETYRPYAKKEARAGSFPEDAFVVGIVAANKGRPSRKGFVPALRAFAQFAAAHENAYLYLHTHINPATAGGENIPALLRELQIPKDRIRMADQYGLMFRPYSPEQMAQTFSAIDVLLNPALGEGFGIPVLEAQACGRPAIVTDFSAMREVCGAGWHVDYEPTFTGLNAWQAQPSVAGIVDALEECYALPPNKREKLERDARRHALGYDVTLVMRDHMLPAIKEGLRRIDGRKAVSIPARKAVAA